MDPFTLNEEPEQHPTPADFCLWRTYILAITSASLELPSLLGAYLRPAHFHIG